MAVSSDTLRLAVVEEATPGTAPATPAWDLVRTTGEGLTYEVTTTQSEEMGGINRGVKDNILTGATVSGSINFELSHNAAFEKLFSAGVGSDWGSTHFAAAWEGNADQVSDYTIERTFSIEKRFTMDDTPTYSYHRFAGCMVDTTNISITPNEPITGSFDFIGQEMTTETAEVAASTYASAGTAPIMTAPLVTGISLLTPPGIDSTSGAPLGTPVPWADDACWTGLDLTLANNGRGLACIGVLGNSETNLGRFEVTGTGSIYYNGDAPLDALIDQTEYAMRVTMTDDEGNFYDLIFPRLALSAATVLASGTNTDVMTEMTLQMLEYQGGVDPAAYALTVKATRSGAAAADPVGTTNKPTQQPSGKQPEQPKKD